MAHDRIWQKDHGSVGDYLNFIESDSRKLKSQGEGRSSFYGATVAEAHAMARTGWPEGTAQVDKLAANLRESVERQYGEITGPAFMPSIAGSLVNVPAYLSGEPETMYAWEQREVVTPIVRIVCAVVVSGGVDSRTIRRRCAAVVALVDLLERSGTRCEVVMLISHESNHRGDGGVAARQFVTVKRPDQPLQVDALAYFLGHESSSRRLGFEAFEAEPEDVFSKTYGGGSYSYCNDLAADDPDRGDIYSPSMDLRYVSSDDEALQWIVDSLRAQGVTLGSAL